MESGDGDIPVGSSGGSRAYVNCCCQNVSTFLSSVHPVATRQGGTGFEVVEAAPAWSLPFRSFAIRGGGDRSRPLINSQPPSVTTSRYAEKCRAWKSLRALDLTSSSSKNRGLFDRKTSEEFESENVKTWI